MILETIAAGIASYLLGAAPSALIITKIFTGKDLRSMGTGNVGAMNSYESSGRKIVGILTLLFDLAKGALAVALSEMIAGEDFAVYLVAASSAVLGHNYNIFLKFRGGRGLAAAAGAFIIINPIFVIVWLFLYSLGLALIKKHVHAGSIFALALSPLAIYLIPGFVVSYFDYSCILEKTELVILASAICIIVLARHYKPFWDLINPSD